MEELRSGQVGCAAAEVYERFFVPALFAEAASKVARIARLQPGDIVLDVACGTGALTRAAYAAVAPEGEVTGLDRNEGMLAVANKTAPEITWRQGMAESLPFDDDTFDAVVSQFGLMFFDDPVAALTEMRRVAKRGGRLAVAVWDAIDRSPGYSALAGLLARTLGEDMAGVMQAPFSLGDALALEALADKSGLARASTTPLRVTARFGSLEMWVTTEIKGWSLADELDEDQLATLLVAARRELAPQIGIDGTVAFECPALVVTAHAE